jgi:hypothetical protein
MSRYDVAVLSFRILALYFLFEVVQGLSQLVAIVTTQWTEPFPAVSWSVPPVLLAALGVLLFWKAPAIARRMFRGDEPMSTTNRPEIGALALRICGILLFAGFLTRSGRLLDIQVLPSAIWVLASALPGAIGVLLFFAAPWLSRRMFGAPLKPMAAALYAHVQAVTFSVLGIWLLVTSLSTLAESVRERIQLGEWGRESWSQITLAALGLLLFVGGVGLSAFWYWIRHAGLKAHADRHS